MHLQVVQSRSDFLGVNSWGPHPSLNREKICFDVFMSSLKRCAMIFPSKTCSKDKEMGQTSVMHVQSCCLLIKPIAFLMLIVLLSSSLLPLNLPIVLYAKHYNGRTLH